MNKYSNCVAMELDDAIGCLEKEGALVCVVEISSKKGVVDSDSKRVVCQRMLANKTTIELVFARFKTKIGEQ